MYESFGISGEAWVHHFSHIASSRARRRLRRRRLVTIASTPRQPSRYSKKFIVCAFIAFAFSAAVSLA